MNILWIALLVLAGTVPQPLASVEGVVTRAGTAEPVPGANVELSRGGESVKTVTTGDDGRFVFDNLQPGDYRVVATRTDGSFVPAEFGQRHPKGSGLPVRVAAGQKVTGIEIHMQPTGSISPGECSCRCPIWSTFCWG